MTNEIEFPDLSDDEPWDIPLELPAMVDLLDLEVRPMESRDARALAEEKHYLHRKPTVSHAYGLHAGLAAVGLVTLGSPASGHLQRGACPGDPSCVIELNRLWVDDAMPPNTASWFVSRALRQMPPRIVVSYADTAYGHMGYVYRAMSFRYAGWTDMERRTPRLDYVPLRGGHSREATRSGYRETVRRRPKVKYWTTTGDRRERRRLARLCTWPSLDWRTLPPPTEHRHHRVR
ncbi:hypothetical protein DEJ49_33145 [Streptomyces venezuelae]|uniref:Uncharacterized protein n=1 Tax=Streptomyces venezuelae TaxID=54571 RepID=A0A5P2CWE8_STRVZ|nr:hypothetical protein [Streptomyces venezuelae]QES45189.1 hypothetical protein DEJ49_33145 [Streptomyces venezuelae]